MLRLSEFNCGDSGVKSSKPAVVDAVPVHSRADLLCSRVPLSVGISNGTSAFTANKWSDKIMEYFTQSAVVTVSEMTYNRVGPPVTTENI
ncbi:hypothetical protein Trydic_g22611 [Trypoxylus dichotomus]